MPPHLPHLICRRICQEGMGSGAHDRRGGRRFVAGSIRRGGERVEVDALSSLIFAGWLPAGRTVSAGADRGSKNERDPNGELRIAHRWVAGRSSALAVTSVSDRPDIQCGPIPGSVLTGRPSRVGGQGGVPAAPARRTDLDTGRSGDHHRSIRGWAESGVGSVVEHGQRPAPSGEFTGDRRVGDGDAFAAFVEGVPAVV